MVYIVGVLYFILGVCFGSFNNVLIYRMPREISVVKRVDSFCPNCGEKIKWYDNIPLFSYIFLLGKCRHCKQKISPRYPLVELGGGVLFLASYLVFGMTTHAAFIAIALSFCFAIAYIDAVSCEIPTSLSIVVAVCGLATMGEDLYFAITNSSGNKMGVWNPFYDKLAAFGAIIVIFALIYFTARFIFKREAMGLGDGILLACMSLSLGCAKLFMVVLIASVTCSIITLILIACKKVKRDQEVPFGPYIAFGYLIAVLFGDMIINGIMSLF